jgi:hypothetical protein
VKGLTLAKGYTLYYDGVNMKGLAPLTTNAFGMFMSGTIPAWTWLTASKPVCTTAAGVPGVCAGTEGVWQAVLTNPVTGPASPTANNLVKFTGTGEATDNTAVILGTMTDGYYCKYATTGTLLSCATQYTVASSLSAQYIDWNQSSGANSIANKPDLSAYTPIIPPTVQSVTCTDSGNGSLGALTITPTANVNRVDISLTVNDVDGCDITMAETSAVAETLVIITNVSAVNTATFTASAGVLTLKYGSPFVMASKQSLILLYKGGEWLEVGRTGDLSTYALLAGRSGGQTLYGGTGSGNPISINSTSNGTKGIVGIDDFLTLDVTNRTAKLYTLNTDPSNYERLGINLAAGSITLAAESAESGSADIDINVTPIGAGSFNINGNGVQPYTFKIKDEYGNTWVNSLVTLAGGSFQLLDPLDLVAPGTYTTTTLNVLPRGIDAQNASSLYISRGVLNHNSIIALFDGSLTSLENGPWNITDVDIDGSTFTIAGNQVKYFPKGGTIRILESTGNNGQYTVSASSYDTTTHIVVYETIPDATIDGNMRCPIRWALLDLYNPVASNPKSSNTQQFYVQHDGVTTDFFLTSDSGGTKSFQVVLNPINDGHAYLSLLNGGSDFTVVDGAVTAVSLAMIDLSVPVAAVASSKVLDSTLVNADLTLTAKIKGVSGDDITIKLTNPGGTGILSIAHTGTDIVVTLARTEGVITSTANDVKGVIDGDTGGAAELVTVAVEGTGLGVVDAFETPLPLLNGVDATVASKGTIRYGTGVYYGTVCDVAITDDLTCWKKFTMSAMP